MPRKRRWFWWGNFSVSVWWSMPLGKYGNGRRGPFVYFSRLANCGRLQLFWLTVSWPMPWAAAVRDLPGYGVEYADVNREIEARKVQTR